MTVWKDPIPGVDYLVWPPDTDFADQSADFPDVSHRRAEALAYFRSHGFSDDPEYVSPYLSIRTGAVVGYHSFSNRRVAKVKERLAHYD